MVNTGSRSINLGDDEEQSNTGCTTMHAAINNFYPVKIFKIAASASTLPVFTSPLQPPTPIELDDKNGDGEGVVPIPSNPRPDAEHPRPSRLLLNPLSSSATYLFSNLSVTNLPLKNQRKEGYHCGKPYIQVCFDSEHTSKSFHEYLCVVSYVWPLFDADIHLNPSTRQGSFGPASKASRPGRELWHRVRDLSPRQGELKLGGKDSQGGRALSYASLFPFNYFSGFSSYSASSREMFSL
ncbi:hypothetical protein BKA65DRAFT_110789 [Rhexocercosporidium sp. MPI-PUGE-AT-0058]|nr:hypothetical protein BKA65DRAFT_110789 [Rhexocercosporidium sp. MPI-PUGE-AT-0058]